MKERITLSALNISIRNTLQDAFPDTVWVVAEISELKENRNGHCYLELIEKDDLSDEIKARMRATIWSYTWRMLKAYFESTTGQIFRQGIKVLVQVSVEFHPAYGLSLNIKDIDPSYTLGDLVLRRKEIIRKLDEAGVLNMNKELSLPTVPQRIAVISSATAAGYQDFTNHLDNNPGRFYFQYELFEAFMQGNETASSIMNALSRIFIREEEFDAVVIIRGGGASVDLSSFDHFDLAYTVAQFPLPIITGIGHEKDDTIVDLVAHTRLKTPTAVAEFLISGAARFFDLLISRQQQLEKSIRDRLKLEQENISDLAEAFSESVEKYLSVERTRMLKTGQRLQQVTSRYTYRKKDELNHIRYRLSEKILRIRQNRTASLRQMVFRLRLSTRLQLEKSGTKVRRYSTDISRITAARFTLGRSRLEELENKLRLLDPDQILKRGYSLTSQGGRILSSIDQIKDNEPLQTRFSDGIVLSKPLTKKKIW
jgi:exodeoxyribonuclease VII large subunit